MSRKFSNLCELTESSTPPIENIDRPIKDWVQEAWLSVSEQLRRDGKVIDSATSAEELFEVFSEHAPLIVTSYYTAIAQHVRDTKGNVNSPNKQKMLEKAFSIDGFNQDGEPWAEVIEDPQAALPFRYVEELDLLSNDPRIKELTDVQREAVNRFVVAFFLQESGVELPRKVTNRLTRDRKASGLPLELTKGRRKGAQKNV